jgi:hypothetical protein
VGWQLLIRQWLGSVCKDKAMATVGSICVADSRFRLFPGCRQPLGAKQKIGNHLADN